MPASKSPSDQHRRSASDGPPSALPAAPAHKSAKTSSIANSIAWEAPRRSANLPPVIRRRPRPMTTTRMPQINLKIGPFISTKLYHQKRRIAKDILWCNTSATRSGRQNTRPLVSCPKTYGCNSTTLQTSTFCSSSSCRYVYLNGVRSIITRNLTLCDVDFPNLRS